MINLQLGLSNPWAKENFKNLWHTGGSVTSHKHWELKFIRHAYTLFEVHVGLTARQDHAGLSSTLGLLGYSINLHVYDDRHWDDENNCWKTYLGEYNEQ